MNTNAGTGHEVSEVSIPFNFYQMLSEYLRVFGLQESVKLRCDLLFYSSVVCFVRVQHGRENFDSKNFLTLIIWPDWCNNTIPVMDRWSAIRQLLRLQGFRLTLQLKATQQRDMFGIDTWYLINCLNWASVSKVILNRTEIMFFTWSIELIGRAAGKNLVTVASK